MQEVMLQKYFLEKRRKNIVKMCSKKKRFGTFGFNTLVKAESQFSLLIKFKNGEKRDDYNTHIFMGKKGEGKVKQCLHLEYYQLNLDKISLS